MNKQLKKRTAGEWEVAIRALPEQWRRCALYTTIWEYGEHTTFSDQPYLKQLKEEFGLDLTDQWELDPDTLRKALIRLGYSEKEAEARLDKRMDVKGYKQPSQRMSEAEKVKRYASVGRRVRGYNYEEVA